MIFLRLDVKTGNGIKSHFLTGTKESLFNHIVKFYSKKDYEIKTYNETEIDFLIKAMKVNFKKIGE